MLITELAHRGNTLACRYPTISKYPTRMKDGHSSDCENNQGTFKDHEGDLVVGQMTIEAVPKLGNTVDAANEDEHSGEEET